MLAQFIWFLRPIIIGDFLLAAMIVYIVTQSKYSQENLPDQEQLLDKQELYQMLVRSQKIWATMASEDSGFRKPSKMLSTMIAKLERYRNNDNSPPQLSLEGSSASGNSLQHEPRSEMSDGTAGAELDFASWLSSGNGLFDWVRDI